MADKCPYAYKRPGTVSLLCEIQPGQKFPICGRPFLFCHPCPLLSDKRCCVFPLRSALMRTSRHICGREGFLPPAWGAYALITAILLARTGTQSMDMDTTTSMLMSAV
jgi:hypothetical protein